ncbi:MAG TPA: bifunctional hydroxymethylpyrimidine kinase/phosphomethylpyrimidine kinase [Bacteroidales bacterium]|nr:bifunctional hydroxymethylpyrimidine kinase/phosphomethylpyrimidine kinase [Bacteroidales bacterium]HCI55703.1 bifunctional hydroxymethylpyrimidine kinase/phosphomethylpyrimidine kinase [Bacteroidales bacterium]HOU96805.1 bifunctional hydroxymethylpyrimidine kinase/phosphomethylpyrimidine kinase [Bacteroidales bacterium]HQG37398.1 bifunctional hydroxymethylpyrimidine kinase/phosphomethylpyrimidine kinase [Bacteroidales bacterium]HQG52014.1 bifunctional hydroxymethylpyrimidine kinase/phosphom
MERQYKRVLTIAGSDSGGGAGIQADIKTISACGCYAMSAITAITVQNTTGVSGVYPVPPEAVSGQIIAVLDDIGTDAVKIGMLYSSEIIMAVKDALEKYRIKNIVLDPVMVAASGDKLLQNEAIETLKKELIPLARIITPNIPEAGILLGEKIQSNNMAEMAVKLSMNKSVSVLLKGGHLTGNDLTDIFYNAEDDSVIELKSKRVVTGNNHGTGCTLSSAVASFLAKGLTLNDAVQNARDYIYQAIVNGAEYTLGKGHGPVHHFYNFWK